MTREKDITDLGLDEEDEEASLPEAQIDDLIDLSAVDAADAVTLVRSECHMDRGAVDRAAAAA